MRIYGTHCIEVGLEILKTGDVGFAYRHVEFCFVPFEAIHLPVFERVAPNQLTWREETLSVLPQPCIGGELPMFCNPRTDRPLRYMDMEPSSNQRLSLGERMAAVES